jgi:uncharacterized protein DUF4136
MNSRLVLITVACAFLPAGAQRVRVDFDHAYHFSHPKTYSWTEVPGSQPSLTLFPNQIMQGRIGALIDEALAAKGLKRVESNGDLVVGYQMNVTEEPVYTTIGDGWGWGWNGSVSTTTTQIVYNGTLVVDVWAARQQKLLFQGVSTQTISSRPSKNTKKLAKAVNEIFEKYPPQG